VREDSATGSGNHVLVDASVDFDREAMAWRATDEIGNVAHHDLSSIAVLRCFEMRLGGNAASTGEVEELRAALAEALRIANLANGSVNGFDPDRESRLAELHRKFLGGQP
jgi:hypothetical protein